MKIELELNGLNCTNCAEKIESMSRELDGVRDSSLNFVTKKLKVDLEDGANYRELTDTIINIVKELEPGVDLVELSQEVSLDPGFLELELNGLNCTNCAGKIEDFSKALDGVKSVDLNFVTKKLKLELRDIKTYEDVKKEIIKTVNELEPDVEIIELTSPQGKSGINLELNGLNCTNCAAKIEDYARSLDGVSQVELNFVTKKLTIDLDDFSKEEAIKTSIISTVNDLEPDVEIIDLGGQKGRNKKLRLLLENLDCANCADKITNFTKAIKGVEDANLDFVSKKLIVEIRPGINIFDVRDEVADIVNTLEPDVKVIDLDRDKKAAKKEVEKKSFFQRVDKKEFGKIVLTTILFILPWLLKLEGSIRFIVYFLAYLIIGNKVIIQAYRNVRAGVPFDENFLMTIATVAAFIIGEYPEAVMVMLLYQIGETMQGIAVNHSRDSITALMDIRPDYANLERNGEVIVVDPSDVTIGDIIVIKPGERVPLDGIVLEGSSSLDTSNITGESVPKTVNEGDEVFSGVVNLHGLIKMEVSKEFTDSTISQILDLVENASSQKAETENFITRFSRYYTPVVVFIAIGIAILSPLLGFETIKESLYRASIFLVISCPCALVISVPLGFFGGLGGASKLGVLIKGGNYLEALTDVDTVVFDKTGTVTEGVFDVTEIKSYGDHTEDEILEIAAYGESFSNHPIGKSIVDKYAKELDMDRLKDYNEIAGKGIDVKIDNRQVLLGNKSLFDGENIAVEKMDSIGTVVYVGLDKKHIGTIIVSDRIKENAKEDLRKLKAVGIKKTVMLSGDNEATVKKVGEILDIDEAYGNLLPQDKVNLFEEILKKKESKKKVAFVGDGVNDAPVLARADVGIAMGGLGSDAAIEASDVVIMTDDIGKISTGINIAKHTKKIVIQNIVLALGVKLVVLILGLFGKATMWQAVFADVGVSIIAIINSMRALRYRE